MFRTRVGYAGGTIPDPTYRSIGDHTEVLQVEFDPGYVSYEGLLELFWTMHDPAARVYSTQYKSIVLATDEKQFQAAARSRTRTEALLCRPVLTEVRRLERFYLAEDYHQKYALRRDALLSDEVEAYYSTPEDFRESALAARLNGYAYGLGSALQLEREIDSYGLSESAQGHLRAIVTRG